MAMKKNGRRTLKGYRIGEWHQNAKYPDEVVAKARALREKDGLSYVKIGQALDVPWPTVRNWVEYETRYG